jgi:hypothetical protein
MFIIDDCEELHVNVIPITTQETGKRQRLGLKAFI